jgi:serine phosphatase RsbU (regulator of sigma subunit)
MVQTAEKERLEGEIAIARTIQQKLLPAPEATLPGISVLAGSLPLAALGGDYYDYFSMPDGRSGGGRRSPDTDCRPACSWRWRRPGSPR